MPNAVIPQFHPDLPIYSAQAPGRLDVMGGVSDYSGGTCLEWPLQVTTVCQVQPNSTSEFVCYSATARSENWPDVISIGSEELAKLNYQSARQRFGGAGDWSRYVLGCFVVLHLEKGWEPRGGAVIMVDSCVPAGAGVSSSAALEVATMTAVARAYDLALGGHEIAVLAQKVENQVAGAPCGLMDQLTVSLGSPGQLVRLLCQPDVVEGYVAVPDGVVFYGLDSGVKHSVAGSAYGKARTGAFMGRTLVARMAPAALTGPDGELYLANLGSDLWRALRLLIPEEMSGAEFLQGHGDHGDPVTRVDPQEIYRVRLAAEHPVYEADRVKRFARLLGAVRENPAARHEFLAAAGELMVQSHFSYDHRCGLGSPETDLLVELARAAGTGQGIYGAKITGGGAGGTVAILADTHANPRVHEIITRIQEEYQERTGHNATQFSGSSAGANCIV